MKLKTTTLLVAALAVGLFSAGCGDDDDDSGDTTEAPAGTEAAAGISKTEFLAQGNQICADGNKEIDQTFSALGENATEEQLTQAATETLVPAVQAQVDGIRALGAPEGDEDQVNQILDAAQSGLDEVSEEPSALFADGPDPFGEANSLAKAYGLTECAG